MNDYMRTVTVFREMKMKKEADLLNPTKIYYTDDFEKQHQEAPGLQMAMNPIPDCGEKSYVGHGRLLGRKMLVTGGDSGIGRAAAIAYAREGADVAINYLEFEQRDAEEVRDIIQAEGRKAVLIPGDIGHERFCESLVETALNELGGLDNLTLVAGMQQYNKDVTTLSDEQMRKTFETNVYSMFRIVRAALPSMPEGSTIVTTSSIQAYQPGEILIDYASSKAAIIGFTRALAKQTAPKGIRANVVAPGPIWTPLQVCGGQPPEKLPAFGQDTPLKRAGQPVELAPVYVFLASEESSYVTAEVYGVTGGMHLA